MPVACDYAWSDALDLVIREEAAAARTPLDLAYAIIAAESGFDPNTHVVTALEDSVGLLELNRRGGQGAGYTVEQLQDPRTNLRIGLPPITRAFEQSWSPEIAPYELIYLVATRSGHPGQVPRNDPRIKRIAGIWACFYGGAGFSMGGPDQGGGPGGGAGISLAASVGLIVFSPFLLTLAVLYEGTQLAYGGKVRAALRPAVSPRQLFAFPRGRFLPSGGPGRGRR